MANGKDPANTRPPSNEGELNYWMRNMVVDHGYDKWEVRMATGLPVDDIEARWESLGKSQGQPGGDVVSRFKIRPYPGGRHPRIAFLDGAMRPQRETKFSVFPPWEDGGYAVVDVPEAIWSGSGAGRGLLYLAHTHVDTFWSKQGVELPKLEWKRSGDSILEIERTLPNRVTFGARVEKRPDLVEMELWLENQSDQSLEGLNVQNCVMLKELKGFAALNNENKEFASPFAACRDEKGTRWVITGWTQCQRPWANANCPCLHADPQFANCAPGETVRLRGLVAFYEGTDIGSEIERLKTRLHAGAEAE